MRKEFHFGSFGASFTLGRYQRVKGICSQIGEDGHFLMWDFDDISEVLVRRSLRLVQEQYQLPPIYLLQTSDANKYHAYCFDVHDFPGVVEVLASTPGIDLHYLAIGILRGYFTLRITPKIFSAERGKGFRHVGVLHSDFLETCSPGECNREVSYWTRRD